MIWRVGRQYCGRAASGDASGASGSATLRCLVWIVKDAETIAGLRVGAAPLAILLPEFAFVCHWFLWTLPR
jgi:hypothetical protein